MTYPPPRSTLFPYTTLFRSPPEPRRQRAVLVVVIKRPEIPPLRIPSQDFPHARLEVDAKTCPHQQKTARSRRRTCLADRKSTRLNSSHSSISYAVFCLKKKK